MFVLRDTLTVHSAIRRLWLAVVFPFLPGCGDNATKPQAPAAVASVTVSPSLTAVPVFATAQFTVTLRDAAGVLLTGRAVRWSTSEANKATVNASVLVTGVHEGPVQITATSEAKTGSARIEVVFLPVVAVTVTPAMVTIAAGVTQQLTASALSNTGYPLPGRVFAWTSSDTGKATVNANGVVTALAAGTVTITANCEGKSASTTVTVVQ